MAPALASNRTGCQAHGACFSFKTAKPNLPLFASHQI